MDQQVTNFLKEHGVTEAAKYLEGIEFESFKMLQREHTKELITNINTRIKFESIFFRWVQGDDRELSSRVLKPSAEAVTIQTDLCEPVTVTSNNMFVDVTNGETGLDENPNNKLDEKANDQGCENVYEMDSKDGIEQETFDEKASDEQNKCEVVEHVDEFNVLGIVDLDFVIITNKYKKEKSLSPGDRISLAHCVLKHILKDDMKRELLPSEFENIATTISILFESESSQTFYIRGHNKVPARGKLFQSYKTFREQLSAAGLISRRKRKREPDSFEEDEEAELNRTGGEATSTIVTKNAIEFLKSHTHPWSEIVSSWNETTDERGVILTNESVEVFIGQFPCLAMANGYELLQNDFRRKYPVIEPAIDSDQFTAQCLKLGASSKDSTAKSILRASSSSRTKSEELVLALRILPFLLPGPRSKATAANPRLNKAEISKRFLSYFKNEADDDRETTEFLSLKIVGTDKHIAFVEMGMVKYPFESIFEALICCFELFFVLGVKYPKATESRSTTTSCKTCNQDFDTVNRFIRHFKTPTHTTDGITEYLCPYDCTRTYSVAKSMRKHIIWHQKQVALPAEIRVTAADELKNEEENQDEENHDEPVGNVEADLDVCSALKNLSVNTMSDEQSLRKQVAVLEEDLFRETIHQFADPVITRSKALSTLRRTHGIFAKVLNHLMQYQIASNIIDGASSLHTLRSLCDSKLMRSEYLTLKELSERELLVEVIPYILERTYKERFRQEIALKKVLHVMHMVNLSDFFTKLFAIENFLDDMFQYIDSLSDDGVWIENIMQSDYWKERKAKVQLDDGEVALPFFIYNDDFEPLNALGSHRGAYKLSGVYIMLPCLPPSVQSKLEYIFLGMLFFSYDRSVYGNTRIFAPFIDQLNSQQTVGVPVNHPKFKRIKLIPLLVIGDNLGLNSMFGFVECFVANHFCRFCRLHRNEMYTSTTEDANMLRNETNYDEQCAMSDQSKTGIKENSAWNKVHHFHITQNRCVDIMHDLFEGGCHIVLCEILESFIYKKKLFTLAKFNHRLRTHDFGPLASNENIAPITYENIENRHLLASASELLLLFCHFPYLVADLVDPDEPEWQVYLKLREIIAVVLQKMVHKDTHILLKTLVMEHHQLMIQVFQRKLSPKLHFMTHYPKIMKSIGPLCFVSSMRFESFHKIFKTMIRNNACRKDIAASCVFKIKMRYANLFMNFKTFNNPIVLTLKVKQVSCREVLSEFRCMLHLSEGVTETKAAEIESVAYKVGMVIQDKVDKGGIPCFVLIRKIFLMDNTILLGCQNLINLGFDNHFYAYSVDFEDFCFIISIDRKKMHYKSSYIFYGPNNKAFVMWD